MTVRDRPWGVSWKEGLAKSEVKQISCICVFCGRCYSEGISYGKPDIGLKRDCSLSGGSYEATWERQMQWITGADGINLRGLIEINCEIAEIVMRSFHVLWLLLGVSKSLETINLIFFFFASSEETLFQNLLPGWGSLRFLDWKVHLGPGCKEG